MLTLDNIAGRFAYNEDHEAFRQTVRQFLQKEGVPKVDQWERDRLVPKDFWRAAGGIGPRGGDVRCGLPGGKGGASDERAGRRAGQDPAQP